LTLGKGRGNDRMQSATSASRAARCEEADDQHRAPPGPRRLALRWLLSLLTGDRVAVVDLQRLSPPSAHPGPCAPSPAASYGLATHPIEVPPFDLRGPRAMTRIHYRRPRTRTSKKFAPNAEESDAACTAPRRAPGNAGEVALSPPRVLGRVASGSSCDWRSRPHARNSGACGGPFPDCEVIVDRVDACLTHEPRTEGAGTVSVISCGAGSRSPVTRSNDRKLDHGETARLDRVARNRR
jgi:hypothetical protein